MKPCPTCKGSQMIKTPDGGLWQMCPKCEGSGVDPGIETGYFAYKAQITLTALQLLQNQKVTLNGAADFRIKLLTKRSTGIFRIRLFDVAGPYSSVGSAASSGISDRVPDTTLFGDGSLPFVIHPHPRIGRNAYIGFDIEDTSNAGNTVELVFHGANVIDSPA